jgi:hypothetical protein
MAITSKKSDTFVGKNPFDYKIEPPLAMHSLMVFDVKALVWFKPTVGSLFFNVLSQSPISLG